MYDNLKIVARIEKEKKKYIFVIFKRILAIEI